MGDTIIIGNWKMNGNLSNCQDLAREIKNKIGESGSKAVILCPPFPFLQIVDSEIKNSKIALGAQDCHQEQKGAHTGDVSSQMLKSIGCGYVIVGHSERRANHKETNEIVRAKAKAAQAENIIAVICVGENLDEYENGQTAEIIKTQVQNSIPENANAENTIIAYEPVWSIGTGKVPTVQEISEVANIIVEMTKNLGNNGNNVRVPVLYGGSVSESNASELIKANNIDGFLVGSASLDAEKFNKIIELTEK